MPAHKQYQVARFGLLTNLGPLALIGYLESLEFLGTHFRIPLGRKNFLTLQNLTEWPSFIQ